VQRIRNSLCPNPDPGFFDDSGSETFDLKFETFSVKNKLKLFATGVDVGFFFDFRGGLRQAPGKNI
jgi:hypothetical protein